MKTLWHESPLRFCLLMYKVSFGWSQAASATMPIILLCVASQKRKQPSPPPDPHCFRRVATVSDDGARSFVQSLRLPNKIAMCTTLSSTTSKLSLVIAGFSPAVGCALNLIVCPPEPTLS